MSESSPKTIDEKVNRIETIIATIQNDTISLSDAKELHEEGQQLLSDLEDDLDIGDAEVTEQ